MASSGTPAASSSPSKHAGSRDLGAIVLTCREDPAQNAWWEDPAQMGGSAAGSHEHPLERLVVLDDVAGAEHDRLERHVRHADRDLGLPLDPLGEAA